MFCRDFHFTFLEQKVSHIFIIAEINKPSMMQTAVKILNAFEYYVTESAKRKKERFMKSLELIFPEYQKI